MCTAPGAEGGAWLTRQLARPERLSCLRGHGQLPRAESVPPGRVVGLAPHVEKVVLVERACDRVGHRCRELRKREGLGREINELLRRERACSHSESGRQHGGSGTEVRLPLRSVASFEGPLDCGSQGMPYPSLSHAGAYGLMHGRARC